jgi:hypothetical protein
MKDKEIIKIAQKIGIGVGIFILIVLLIAIIMAWLPIFTK